MCSVIAPSIIFILYSNILSLLSSSNCSIVTCTYWYAFVPPFPFTGTLAYLGWRLISSTCILYSYRPVRAYTALYSYLYSAIWTSIRAVVLIQDKSVTIEIKTPTQFESYFLLWYVNQLKVFTLGGLLNLADCLTFWITLPPGQRSLSINIRIYSHTLSLINCAINELISGCILIFAKLLLLGYKPHSCCKKYHIWKKKRDFL